MGCVVTIEHDCEAEDGDRWVSLRTIAGARVPSTGVCQFVSGWRGSIPTTQASWWDELAK